MKLTPHFCLEEFKSKDGADTPDFVKRNLLLLAQNLEVLRKNIGEAIRIHSGYRSVWHNRNIGGVANSQHLLGKAADISAQSLAPEQLAKTIEKLIEQGKMQQGAVGVYSSFVHYDIRGEKVRFKGKY